MFAPSTLDQQLAASWNAARTDAAGGRRARLAVRRRRLQRLIRGGR